MSFSKSIAVAALALQACQSLESSADSSKFMTSLLRKCYQSEPIDNNPSSKVPDWARRAEKCFRVENGVEEEDAPEKGRPGDRPAHPASVIRLANLPRWQRKTVGHLQKRKDDQKENQVSTEKSQNPSVEFKDGKARRRVRSRFNDPREEQPLPTNAEEIAVGKLLPTTISGIGLGVSAVFLSQNMGDPAYYISMLALPFLLIALSVWILQMQCSSKHPVLRVAVVSTIGLCGMIGGHFAFDGIINAALPEDVPDFHANGFLVCIIVAFALLGMLLYFLRATKVINICPNQQ